VQHFRDFGRFQINKRDLGRQREDQLKKKFFTKLEANQAHVQNAAL
jgi:hypothetical protein